MHLKTFLLYAPLAVQAVAVPAFSSEDRSAAPALPERRHTQSSSGVDSRANSLKLISQLNNAATAVDRLNLLKQDSDFVYDFGHAVEGAATIGKGGHTVKADRKTFPALIGTGVGMTVGFLGPCGFNTPHTHPRSSEINFVAQGRLIAEFLGENGARVVRNEVKQHQMTVFPQGALHTEFNPDCDPAMFVAGFASEDPGVQQAAQSMFELSDDIVEAAFANDFTFDGGDIDEFRGLIPDNVAKGVEKCLKKCNIKKK